MQAHKLDVPVVGAQVRTHALESTLHARLDWLGMQSMQQQHTRHEIVREGLVERRFTSSRLRDTVDHALERGAMHLHDALQELKRRSPELGIRRAVETVYQSLDTFRVRAKLAPLACA